MTSLWKRYGAQPLPLPYIPLKDKKEIHVTDLGQYCQCRWAWDWSSLLRQGLQPALLPQPLLFGQAVHLGLDCGYRGSVGTGEPASFNTSEALQAFDEWVVAQRQRVIEYTGPLWQHEKEQFSEIETLGKIMLKHYELWVKSTRTPLDSGYEFLGTEHLFKLPLPGTRNLAYAGRIDGLVQERNTGNIYIVEFKTTRSLSYMGNVFRGLQATAYLWAAQQLYGKKVTGILYRVLVKKLPANPKPLARGGFSKDKRIKSTPEWYSHCLKTVAKLDAADSGEDWKQLARSYHQAATPTLNMLKARENGFFLQVKLQRSQRQIDSTVEVLRELGKEMANPRIRIFRRSGFHCGFCRFKDPCDLRILGYDYQAVIDAEYARRSYWEREEPSGASRSG